MRSYEHLKKSNLRRRHLNVISLGMGVQSTAMYLMSCTGELPRADYAVFADTGREKTATMKMLRWLLQWKKKNGGIEIIIVKEKNLYQDLLSPEPGRFASIPAYTTKGGGMLRRQCTNEYKIEQVDKAIRNLYGLDARMWTRPTTIWKGITIDEVERVSIPQEGWKTYLYPFCGYQTQKVDSPTMSRTDILAWYGRTGFPVPAKSSCVFCPYQSDAAWKELKETYPKDFADAVRVDEAIRNSTQKGITEPAFLHRSGTPLKDVKFQEGNADLWSGECSGNCHV